MLITNNLSQVMRDMLKPDSVLDSVHLPPELQEQISQVLKSDTQHKNRRVWYTLLKDLQNATQGKNLNAYLCVSYLLALELDSTLFQTEVFVDEYRCGVIAHASGRDGISIALYGTTCYFLNGFTGWSEYKKRSHSGSVLDFDLFVCYDGFETNGRALEFGAFGKVEPVLSTALMLMTGQHKPVKLH